MNLPSSGSISFSLPPDLIYVNSYVYVSALLKKPWDTCFLYIILFYSVYIVFPILI